ncbi:YqaA family protein, partial [Aurantimonas sp. A2-1-M11]|uniref:YqaA family protein n=1 Tax=Aurantimonas sp. A2-1-M11 TaxID=3113712 RepID=UPI002F95EA99
GVFWSAFLAASILPGASEVLLVRGTGEPLFVIATATVGNTLGSVTNWACGRFLLHYCDHRWFPVSPRQIEGSLLFAWTPVVGDALTVIAGTLRVPIVQFTLLFGIGKLGRYLVVAGGAMAMGGSEP